MIISSPPFQVGEELRSLLNCGPGAACQCCHSMTDSQWSPLDKSSVEPPREAQSLQGSLESYACSKTHHLRDPHQLAPPKDFLHLTIKQLCRHLPLICFPPTMIHLAPLSKMGRQGVEVQI